MALSAGRATKAKLNNGDRYREFVVASSNTIHPGGLVGINAAGAAIAGVTGAVFIAGWADPDGKTATEGDRVRILEGEAWFSHTGLTAANRGDIAYVVDDEEVSVTFAGTAVAGVIVDYDASRGVLVHIEFPMNAILARTAAANIQKGSTTLVSGTATVDTTIVLTATSQILVSHDGNPTGSTNYAGLAVTSRTPGAAGVAAFTINALVAAGTIDSDAAGDVDWLIVG
jgi:hypothetical protein